MSRRTCEFTAGAADDIETRFRSYLRDNNSDNVQEDEEEFFENYEDQLCMYNEDYQNEELVDDPEEADSEEPEALSDEVEAMVLDINPLNFFVDDQILE